jgi:hypothetical protein
LRIIIAAGRKQTTADAAGRDEPLHENALGHVASTGEPSDIWPWGDAEQMPSRHSISSRFERRDARRETLCFQRETQ